MLGFQGPAQPSPALGDALNAGYRYLEVRCLGCDTHQTVALDIVRRLSWSDTCAARIAQRCAQPSGRAATYEDFCERPALDMVAGRTVVFAVTATGSK